MVNQTTQDTASSTSTMTTTTRDLGMQFENEFQKIVIDKDGKHDVRSVHAVDVNHMLAEMRF